MDGLLFIGAVIAVGIVIARTLIDDRRSDTGPVTNAHAARLLYEKSRNPRIAGKSGRRGGA